MSELVKKIDISIVVTVYNIAQYISDCLDSILCQNDNIEIEVICVDDASTDESMSILKTYKRNDCRVKILSNKINLGQASSRNRGCRIASGKYLYVIDGDDYLANNCLKKMFDIAQNNQLDLLTFNACSFWDDFSDDTMDSYQMYIRKGSYNGVLSGPELFSQFIDNNDMLGNVCLNFYRRDFFEKENLYWTEGARYNEDSPFSIYMAAKRAMCIPEVFYMRRRHMGSVTTSPMRAEYQEGQMIQFLSELEIWNRYSFTEEVDKNIELYFKRFHCEIKKLYRLLGSKREKSIFQDKMARYIYNYFFLTMPLRTDIFLTEQIEKIKKAKIIIIYGSGNIAYDVVEVLEYYGVDDYLVAVTKKNKKEEMFKNKIIYEIEELKYLKENAIVIVATSTKYNSDMYVNARKSGFINVIKLQNV